MKISNFYENCCKFIYLNRIFNILKYKYYYEQKDQTFFEQKFWVCIFFIFFRLWALIVSLIFLILGLINSSFLTPLNLIWIKFGLLLGKFVSPIVMGLVFFFVVTPTGLIMKLLNKDLLNLKKKNKKSYWIRRKSKSNMKNQF